MKLEDRLAQKLAQRQAHGNLRKLKVQDHLIDFCSNDYLGLAQNQHLKQKVDHALVQNPNYKTGATGSRLISGNSNYIRQLEEYLANYFQAESAIIFNSGYQANSGFLATIPQKSDTILCDELIHASLREGARLSFAEKHYFKHNDIYDLEKKLQKATGTKFVVIESVYSMDGDRGDLINILEMAEKYQAYTILDEAHGVGIFGQHGEGLACEQDLASRFFARIYTFGKAVASHGACIVGSALLKKYLLNYARSFIYTTALPFHTLVSIRCAFEMMSTFPDLKDQLHHKIKLFKDSMKDLDSPSINLRDTDTPIQILQTKGNEWTKYIAQNLVNQGFNIYPVLSPTVREGAEIIRICLHTSNTDEQIIRLARQITQLKVMENSI